MPHEPLTVGSLFSGIGGIDLGLERAGMVTRWFVEWDAHCQNVLRRHWPGVPVYGDITTVDWGTVEPVDVLAGGFPCQPISSAGRQQAQDDDRWLWPEFTRAIRSLQPRYVLVENVRNLLAVNDGSAMGEVVGDLATLGYDAEWDCVPASAVGAPHERDRLWLVAYAERPSQGRGGVPRSRQDSGAVVAWSSTQPLGSREAVADAASLGPPGPGQSLQSIYPATHPNREASQPLDGRLAQQWELEPDVGRVADGVPDRVDRLRSLGNAVVPQVVEWIGHRIVAFEAGREVTEDAA